MFQKDKLSDLLEDRVTVGKGLEEPPLRGLKEVPAPFSLPSLIAWLETKNPDDEYDWDDYSNCLISQYSRTTDFIAKDDDSFMMVCAKFARNDGGDWSNTPALKVALHTPHTFGGALDRALVLQANAVSGSSPILISEGV